MNEDKILISNYVVALRAKEQLSIREFAKAHNISTSTVCRYENGEMDDPNSTTAIRFCNTFDVSESQFIAEFEYSNNKVHTILDNVANIKSRWRNDFNDANHLKIVKEWFTENKDVFGLSNLEIIDSDSIAYNEFALQHSCNTYNRKGEQIWIQQQMYSVKKNVFGDIYENIMRQVLTIATVNSKHLPNRCKNFLYFTPSKECFDYIVNFPMVASSDNNFIIYYVDKNKANKKIVKFGNDFLECK